MWHKLLVPILVVVNLLVGTLVYRDHNKPMPPPVPEVKQEQVITKPTVVPTHTVVKHKPNKVINHSNKSGPDLGYSCATVRWYYERFGESELKIWANTNHLTSQQIDKAKQCLK